jgi:hypothetical protein
MQKIFIVHSDYNCSETEGGSFHLVNAFIGKSGFIVSVNPQEVRSSKDDMRGRWLIVADDGLGEQKTL